MSTSGPLPDPDDDLGPELNTIAWVFTSLALISVGLRLYTRTRILRAFGWDDVVITWAMIINIVSSSMYTASVAAGLGRHIAYVPKDQVVYAIKLNVITASIVVHSFSWPKLAIVILLNRLLLPNRIMKTVLYFLVTTLICCSFVLTILWLRQCTPIQKNWDKTAQGHCLNPAVLTDFSYFTGSYSAFQDLFFAVYPVIVISRLQMPLRRKIALSAILSLGFVAFAVTIYKSVVLRHLGQTQDLTYYTTSAYVWTALESGIVIIIACLPTLSPLVRLLTGKKPTTTEGSYRSGGRSTTKQSQLGSNGMFGKNSELSRSKGRRDMSNAADDINLLDMPSGYAKSATPIRVSEEKGQARTGNGGTSVSHMNTRGAPARETTALPGERDSDEELGVAVTTTVDVSIEPDGGRNSRTQQNYGTANGHDRQMVNDLENAWRL